VPWDATTAWTTVAVIVNFVFVVLGVAVAVFLIRFLIEGTRAFRKYNSNGAPKQATENLRIKTSPRTASPVPPENPHAPPTPALGIPRPPAWKPPPSPDRPNQ
jgi:hypothetical protein